eukprot:c15947_g1_i1 orf=356-907(+)
MKMASLADNAGLACIALQYVHAFDQECDEVGKARPAEKLLNSTFAAACGVAPSSVVTPLSGVLLYCQGSYVKPSEAFQHLLGSNSSTSLAIISNASHTEMGVAVGSYDGGSPFYWAALFSDAPPNSTFLFSDGQPLMQHEGCFSGLGQPCSKAPPPPTLSTPFILATTSLLWFLLTTAPPPHF